MNRKIGFSKIYRNPISIIVTFFIVINIFFIVTAYDSYFQIDNYFYMLKQTAMIIIVASAATILMMTGNFDLSTGSVAAFAGCVYALLIKERDGADSGRYLCGCCWNRYRYHKWSNGYETQFPALYRHALYDVHFQGNCLDIGEWSNHTRQYAAGNR